MNKLIVLVILQVFFCCNQRAETSNSINKNITKQYNFEVSLLDSLSEAKLGNNKIKVQTYWLQILNRKDSVIKYLLSLRGKKELSKWL